jgi:hypothetical protein
LFLRLIIEKKDPIEINATPKNAALSFGRIPRLSPIVKKTIAIPATIGVLWWIRHELNKKP